MSIEQRDVKAAFVSTKNSVTPKGVSAGRNTKAAATVVAGVIVTGVGAACGWAQGFVKGLGS